MKITEANPSEIPLIQSLAENIWWKHYPAIIGEKQVSYMLNKMYSAEKLSQQMKAGHRFFLISENEIAIGFIGVEERENDELFLHKFYMETDHQRSGMGTKAFEWLVKKFSSTAMIRLTVNRQNFKAINFYFKNGFIIEKVADFDIGDGYVMNDFVMLRKK